MIIPFELSETILIKIPTHFLIVISRDNNKLLTTNKINYGIWVSSRATYLMFSL